MPSITSFAWDKSAFTKGLAWTQRTKTTSMPKEQENVHLSFIGCGVMAESMIAGLLREKLVAAEGIVGSHPRESRRAELEDKYGIRMFGSNAEAARYVLGRLT